MDLRSTIVAKRDGKSLSKQQIDHFVAAAADASTPDHLLSAGLMACFINGLNDIETANLTYAMAHSGECYTWPKVKRPLVDKHSTGGVGDKLSLLVAPLAAACGLAVPMMSGRSLGITGGTLDKLESIPGFRTQLNYAEMQAQLATLGCVIVGQSDDLAPADRRLYALRDSSGSVSSMPLIVSSILSKKLAEGTQGLVMDIKVGEGAFMPDMRSARQLGKLLLATAKTLGLDTSILYTSMDRPLGRSVGNLVEVREALDLLRDNQSSEITTLTLQIVAQMLVLGGISESEEQALVLAARQLNNGNAYALLIDMIRAQGGSIDQLREDYGLPAAPVVKQLKANKDGFLALPNARKIGEIALLLGAGRHAGSIDVDPFAGIRFAQDYGCSVATGDLVLDIYGSDNAKVDLAFAQLEKLDLIGDDPASITPLLIDQDD